MKPWILAVVTVLALGASGCSLRAMATGALADALSGPSNLGSDDDPELVREAAPFGLKTMESLLEAQPHHVGLLTSLASGFAQYGYAFVQQDADRLELLGRFGEAGVARTRAKKLFLRARNYGLKGLEIGAPGIGGRLMAMQALPEALSAFKKEDVPLLYWTAASWALAIANGKENMALVAQLPAPEALMRRALELDETWHDGALHEFFVSFEAARPGGTEERAQRHLKASLALSEGRHLGVWVSWAEGPLVQAQKREEFEKVLNQVLRADVSASGPDRLANLIAQRRAKLLLEHADDLFN